MTSELFGLFWCVFKRAGKPFTNANLARTETGSLCTNCWKKSSASPGSSKKFKRI